MTKTIWTIVIVIVIIIVGFFLFYQQGAENGPAAPALETAQAPAAPEPEAAPAAPSYPPGAVVKVTDDGFSPASVQIKKGEAVTFINESSRDVWPASAVHPTHGVYPEAGGCINSKFDACRGLKTGESWSFSFVVSGIWKYHNHLNPSDKGEINVIE